MASDYDCFVWPADISIISSNFKPPEDDRPYFFIKIIVNVSIFDERTTDFSVVRSSQDVDYVLVSCDELIMHNEEEASSSVMRRALSLLDGRHIDYQPMSGHIRNRIVNCANWMASDPHNTGVKILPMVASIAVDKPGEPQFAEDLEEEVVLGGGEENSEENGKTELRQRPVSEAYAAALETVRIEESCPHKTGVRDMS